MATIRVYARIHPNSPASPLIEIQGDRLIASKTPVRCQHNSTDIAFTFDGIFQRDANQNEVFNRAAKDVVKKFVSGFNGTIFAYGQTGTGKTYTVEGEELSKNTSASHGLIPQTLSFLFKEIENLDDECATVQISFIELYNETAYDLLGPLMYGTNNKRDLPKVLVSVGSNGSCLLHGLSLHNVKSEHEARKLHLKGRCNRTVASTESNSQSSRSHALFTILLTRQQQDSDVLLQSKLHLVDLAGSESYNKKDGTLSHSVNMETKHVNLSLHHLETVILSLQNRHLQKLRNSRNESSSSKVKIQRCKSEICVRNVQNSPSNVLGPNGLKSQSATDFNQLRRCGHSISVGTSVHVSYRNSLLTMMLQDSLGGNCNTVMIATLSLKPLNFNETLSTCRFAQRVARVTNNPIVNKSVNEAILIKKLQNKVSKLTQELLAVKQSASDKNLRNQLITSEERAEVINIVQGYLNGNIKDPLEKGIDGPHKVRACLVYLKDLVIQNNRKFLSEPNSCDEKDSGVVMCSSIPTNTSEDEPCSPTLTYGSSNSIEMSGCAPPSCARTEVLNPCSTKDDLRIEPQIAERCVTSAPTSQHFFTSAQDQTGTRSTTSSAKSTDQLKVDQTEKEMVLWKLELQKQNLIHKSKHLGTALSNQKARIIVMEKHGCPLDEIDNERLAEQQLRRKQAEVEQRLSVLIKRIVDVKAGSSFSYQQSDTVGQTGIDKGQDGSANMSNTLEIRRLDLQEQATRLKLLSFREKLVPGLLCSSAKVFKNPQPPQEDQDPPSMDGGSIRSFATCSSSRGQCHSPAGHGNSSHKMQNISSKQSHKTSKIESPYETRSRRRPVTVSISRRSTFKDSMSMASNKALPRRQSGKLQPQRPAWLPAIARKTTGSLRALSKPSSRTRRPAMCSSVLLSNSQPIRQPPRTKSSVAHYDFEPSNGFIVRINNKVYRASSFKKDKLVGGNNRLQPTIPYQKTSSASSSKYGDTYNRPSGGCGRDGQRSHSSSPRGCSEDGERSLNSSLGGCGEDGERSHNSSPEGCSEDDLKSHDSSSRVQMPFPGNSKSVNGPKHDEGHKGPLQELKTSSKMSLTVVKSRKLQIERAKRIREVIKAAEIIQAAYRRHMRHKRAVIVK